MRDLTHDLPPINVDSATRSHTVSLFLSSQRALGAAAFALAVLMPQVASAATTPLISAPTGLCLDVKGADATPRTLVQLWSCHQGSNQAWEYTAAGELRTFGGIDHSIARQPVRRDRRG